MRKLVEFLQWKQSRLSMPQNVTECHILKECKELSQKQSQAIDLLLMGKTDVEIASCLDVERKTVWRWRNQNPNFLTVLNQRRTKVWESSTAQFKDIVSQSIDVVQQALNKGDVSAALTILWIFGLPPATKADSAAQTVDHTWQQLQGLENLMDLPELED